MNRQIALALSTMWASRALTMALSFLLMPILFRKLPSTELGTWLLFGQAAGIVGFLDFGMTSVLTRRVAIVSVRQPDEAPSVRDMRLGELLAVARLLYRAAGGIAFVGALGAGWVLVTRIGLDAPMIGRAHLVWALLCVSCSIGLGNGMWSAMAWGTGRVAAASMISTAVSAGTLVLTALVVLLGGGMAAMAAVTLVSSLATRLFMLRLLRRHEPGLLHLRGQPSRAGIVALLQPSLKYWLTEVGAIMLLRTDQFFIAGFQDPARIPAYYAAYNLVYNMAMVSMAIGDVSSIYVSKLWNERAPGVVQVLVIRNLRIGISLMLSGAALTALIGQDLIAVWLGPGHFAGRPVLLTFCVMLTLFVQQSLLLGFSRATENEVYASCYLLAGTLNIAFTWALARPFGLAGIALGTLLAQAVTTNWFIPSHALCRLGIKWRRYAMQVLLPAGGVFAMTGGAIWGATQRLPATWAFQRTAFGTAAGAIALSVGFWFLVFDAETRRQIRHEAGALGVRLRALTAR